MNKDIEKYQELCLLDDILAQCDSRTRMYMGERIC